MSESPRDEAARYEVTAFNFAADSDNKIHDDEEAAKFGFKGGLVPGVAVFGYMSRPVVDLWGEAWLSSGWMQAKFIRPAYHGDRVVARALRDGDELELELLDSDGQLCGAGRAGQGDAGTLRHDELASHALPAERFAPLAPALEEMDALGSLDVSAEAAACSAEVGERYRDELGLYRRAEGGVPPLHPAFLPDQANSILVANIAVGPWIHTETHLQLHGLVEPTERMELRGRRAGSGEKRGHHFVELDVGLYCGEDLRASMRHNAIVTPRQSV